MLLQKYYSEENIVYSQKIFSFLRRDYVFENISLWAICHRISKLEDGI